MASGKKGLGGGLSNLFGDTTVVDLKTETSADSVSKIAVSRIEPNPGQPRKVFAQEALDELAESIRLHGVITPITVRAGKKEGYYQIIAGERRWRAARQAGLDEIPAMVIEASESEVMELALIENLQRQDLNPIEEAEGYEQLMRDYGLTQEQVAQRVVKSRPAPMRFVCFSCPARSGPWSAGESSPAAMRARCSPSRRRISASKPQSRWPA